MKKINKIKKVNLNKGITLIALIITIIVLLILAGITLAMVVENNGIIAKAQSAKTQTENAQRDEDNKLKDLENEVNNYSTIRNGISYTILWDASKEGETTLKTVNDFRNLPNVNNYDFLLVYPNIADGSATREPIIVFKEDFNKQVDGELTYLSTDAATRGVHFKIDSQNNKIILISKGHSDISISRVIGIN